MARAILILFALLLFKAAFPKRQQRSTTTVTPYGSVFDIAVPAEVACSPLCDPSEMVRRRQSRS